MSVPNSEVGDSGVAVPEPTEMLSQQKLRWWSTPTVVDGLTNPKIGVLLNLMSRIPRPTRPGESLFSGYLRLAKFHDHEPELLVGALLALDPQFFDTYPTRNMRPLDRAGMKFVLGEACTAFLRQGVPGYRHARRTGDGMMCPAFDAAIAAAVQHVSAGTVSASGVSAGLPADTDAPGAPAAVCPNAAPVDPHAGADG